MNQYQETRKIIDIQEKKIQNSNIKTFMNSFVADVLVFTAALVTVVITFIIIYMLTGQSKLKMLVANIALLKDPSISRLQYYQNIKTHFP